MTATPSEDPHRVASHSPPLAGESVIEGVAQDDERGPAPSSEPPPLPGEGARGEAVSRLLARFEADYTACGQRRYVIPAEAQALAEAIRRAYQATVGAPAVLRRARVLTEFAASAPVQAHPDDLLLGSQRFADLTAAPDPAALESLGYARTTGHIVHDYEGLLRNGIPGYRQALTVALSQAIDADSRAHLQGFSEALSAFETFLRRHAEVAEDSERASDLRYLLSHPPATFPQALQLLWLGHVFLHAENPCAAISLGRIDQYLWPFLQADLAAKRLTLQEAFELICAFCLKCCEGDESQNAVLGGVDPHGREATNPLSFLFLEAVRQLRSFQPSLTVRVHPGADPAFLAAACDLAAAGLGQPGFMNDSVVIPALQAVGVPLERARDWAVVGCYEAVPPGDSYPNTVLGQLHLAKVLSSFLSTDRAQGAATFPDFLEGWFEHVAEVYDEILASCQARWNEMRDRAPSPFGSLLMRGCLERALPLEAGAAPYNFVGLNILGLGTLVDSLHALRTLVFEERALSLTELAEAVAADFPDEALRTRLLALPGRYGTDSPATNELAAQLSSRLARMVLDSRMENGVRPYPGFFAFAADIYALGLASPDGRHAQDPVSYGVAASGAVACPVTSLLRSASHVAHQLCACGDPLALTLQPADLSGPRGAQLIQDLVETYFNLGGLHLHFNVATARQMREAQAHPERWANLTVRVSGYSARFLTVDRRWQDVLIARAEQDR